MSWLKIGAWIFMQLEPSVADKKPRLALASIAFHAMLFA
jgi:hypothetical protein